MLSRVVSGSVVGLDGYRVDVEVDLSLGLPGFNIVGLPDTAVQESKERVRAAIVNSEFHLPVRRITVNLAPGDIRKEGPIFDLPIAIGIIKAADTSLAISADKYLIVGELSLDGQVKPINGVLPLAVAAERLGMKGMVVPKRNAKEAAVVRGIKVFGVETLPEAIAFLGGDLDLKPEKGPALRGPSRTGSGDNFADVKGHEHAKRALEIAAAGGHNILLIGPPGSGKSMLARRLPSILPAMDFAESIDVTRIYSVAGMLGRRSLVTDRPFRAPHHTISTAGLAGGGQSPRPGEVSLSHHGVLFLDEFAEFAKNVLQVLRQPMEEGTVTISRAGGMLTYPCSFMLVAATNPCPCGYFGDRKHQCVCSVARVRQYMSRLSGPIMDRIDLQVEVPRLTKEEMLGRAAGEDSRRIRDRVERARSVQKARGRGVLNSSLSAAELQGFGALGKESVDFMGAAIEKLGLSARGLDRVQRVARTIADLAGSEKIDTAHLAEAVSYRSLDRSWL